MKNHREDETDVGDSCLEVSVAAAIYVEHSAELSRFLLGVLRDSHLVSDVLQIAFTRLVEKGGEAEVQTRKSWLFRVAYNEAMAIKRRESTGRRAAAAKQHLLPAVEPSSDHAMLRSESIIQVREAIAQLSPEQREVVKRRIYDEKTFAEIADELGITIGAALGRMHSALKKLRSRLSESKS